MNVVINFLELLPASCMIVHLNRDLLRPIDSDQSGWVAVYS